VTVRNLIRLAQLTGDASYLERAQATLGAVRAGLAQVVRVMPMMAANLALWHARRTEIVIAGTSGESGFEEIERVVAGRYLPWSVVAPLDPAAPGSKDRFGSMPWLGAMTSEGRPRDGLLCVRTSRVRHRPALLTNSANNSTTRWPQGEYWRSAVEPAPTYTGNAL
jgi:hypothetical protein